MQTRFVARAEVYFREGLDRRVVPRARPGPGHAGDEAAAVLGLHRVEQLHVGRRMDVLGEVIGCPGHAAVGPSLALERPELDRARWFEAVELDEVYLARGFEYPQRVRLILQRAGVGLRNIADIARQDIGGGGTRHRRIHAVGHCRAVLVDDRELVGEAFRNIGDGGDLAKDRAFNRAARRRIRRQAGRVGERARLPKPVLAKDADKAPAVVDVGDRDAERGRLPERPMHRAPITKAGWALARIGAGAQGDGDIGAPPGRGGLRRTVENRLDRCTSASIASPELRKLATLRRRRGARVVEFGRDGLSTGGCGLGLGFVGCAIGDLTGRHPDR